MVICPLLTKNRVRLRRGSPLANTPSNPMSIMVSSTMCCYLATRSNRRSKLGPYLTMRCLPQEITCRQCGGLPTPISPSPMSTPMKSKTNFKQDAKTQTNHKPRRHYLRPMHRHHRVGILECARHKHIHPPPPPSQHLEVGIRGTTLPLWNQNNCWFNSELTWLLSSPSWYIPRA